MVSKSQSRRIAAQSAKPRERYQSYASWKTPAIKVFSVTEKPLPSFEMKTRTSAVLASVKETVAALGPQQYMEINDCSPYVAGKIVKYCREVKVNYRYVRDTRTMYIVNGEI